MIVRVFVAVMIVLVVGGGGNWSVEVKRESSTPLVSWQPPQQNSGWRWNYNAAVVPDGRLLVRCQNPLEGSSDPYATSSSVLALTDATKPLLTDPTSVVFSSSDDPQANYGTEDPRLVEVQTDDGERTFWMTYTAAHQFANGSVVAKLSLASSPSLAKGSWKVLGEMLPDIPYSKSGAMVLRGQGLPTAMIFGDSSLVPGLQLALHQGGAPFINWTVQPGIYLPVRQDHFDSHLVEAGPPPLPLADGSHQIFFYNSARAGYPSPKPGYSLQYNIGYVILDSGLKIVQRSALPILSPQLPWERGTDGSLALTPNVVFCNGAVALGNNSFRLFYGGADSVIGTALVTVLDM